MKLGCQSINNDVNEIFHPSGTSSRMLFNDGAHLIRQGVLDRIDQIIMFFQPCYLFDLLE